MAVRVWILLLVGLLLAGVSLSRHDRAMSSLRDAIPLVEKDDTIYLRMVRAIELLRRERRARGRP